MKEDRNNELLIRVLEKYKFTAPVPPEVRREIMKRKRKILVNILKRYGAYTPFVGASLTVFLFMRNVGFSLTLIQSAGILVVATALAAATVTGGVYYTVTRVLSRPTAVELPSPPAENGSTTISDRPSAPRDGLQLSPPTYYIAPVDVSEGVTQEASEKVKAAIFSEITRAKGPGSVTYAPSTPAVRGVAFTMEKAGDAYTLTARLVDRDTGRILHIFTETATRDSLYKMSRKIAQNIIAFEK